MRPPSKSKYPAETGTAAAVPNETYVAFVETKDYYRPKRLSPSGQAYHWNTNAETYFLISDGMAKAMKKLYETKQKNRPSQPPPNKKNRRKQ